MRYEGDIYRPPSEAYSLIVQVTVGCSHNKCSFCSMYKEKDFHVRPFADVLADLRECRLRYKSVGRIFFADGDCLCLSAEKLLPIVQVASELFPECSRIAVYGSARHALSKTKAELSELCAAGLGMVYIGAESGSPEVLKRICKGETPESLATGVRALEEAGIKTSVTFISGMGGKELWKEHAELSAKLLCAMQPSYASLLTLMLSPLAPITKEIEEGRFQLLSPLEVLDETELFIRNVELAKPCVFRSNHASNYLNLKGDLPGDKERFLLEIAAAKANPNILKPEFFRAL